jgi:hypothetical protein
MCELDDPLKLSYLFSFTCLGFGHKLYSEKSEPLASVTYRLSAIHHKTYPYEIWIKRPLISATVTTAKASVEAARANPRTWLNNPTGS